MGANLSQHILKAISPNQAALKWNWYPELQGNSQLQQPESGSFTIQNVLTQICFHAGESEQDT